MLAYVVRHAQSEHNAQTEMGLNSGLSSLGREQTAALLRRFADLRIDAVYCSPFLRCIETALPIAKALGRRVYLRPELCEYHHLPLGTKVDLHLDDAATISTRHPGVEPCPDCRGPCVWPPPDESFEDMVRRAQSFARFLKARWAGGEETVLCIGHGSPTARLIEAWLTDQPGPSFRFIIDNAAVSALRFHAGVSSLVCLNEISHLRGLAAPDAANYLADGSIRPTPPSNYW